MVVVGGWVSWAGSPRAGVVGDRQRGGAKIAIDGSQIVGRGPELERNAGSIPKLDPSPSMTFRRLQDLKFIRRLGTLPGCFSFTNPLQPQTRTKPNPDGPGSQGVKMKGKLELWGAS